MELTAVRKEGQGMCHVDAGEPCGDGPTRSSGLLVDKGLEDRIRDAGAFSQVGSIHSLREKTLRYVSAAMLRRWWREAR